MGIDLKKYHEKLRKIETLKTSGKVTQIVGLVVEVSGLRGSIGELCSIISRNEETVIVAEIVGFKEDKALLMPLGDLHGIGPGARVISSEEEFKVAVGENLLGRVLDGLGRPLDDKGLVKTKEFYSAYNSPSDPLNRKKIDEPVATGIRSIDGALTVGKGQRMGIFAGSGVGKSTALGMIARNTNADINVIALIGERGREVRDFIEKDLGKEGLKRSVVIAATSDQPALIRRMGAFVATSIAEYFRDKGYNVMLMMDSVTRFAMAQREIGLAIGEPPTTKGYTPSVFALLPKLLERAGTTAHKGSITGLYTVLVEADDMNEPISDHVRAILDGHIVLSRALAAQSHYPPVDLLDSVSRCMTDITDEKHRKAASRLKEVLSVYKNAEDLINIGAYVEGSNPQIDYALKKISAIKQFLIQGIEEKTDYKQTTARLMELFV
ncbi:MAG TPA: flagellar protein export ATPase FliI [Candidatus Goldiibacteriota bacterium]|nr:flagellar protein export ATPase FliI [Candidatus Goldiibacteriota bacterium]HPN64294.1 flagellar protein export ATPase FliI [Candidatus Goldiibacteriota bacterium]HRQ43926.1 flagellar protein export ATPase FliI [Candidatus Goldiibacteriota bacterium]